MIGAIALTGIGIVSPLGMTREETWVQIKKSRSLVSASNCEFFDPDFSPYVRTAPFVNPNGRHRIFTLALSAVSEALMDAKIKIDSGNQERIGCSVSVSKPILATPGLGVTSPEAVGDFLSQKLGLSGPRRNLIAACATGIHSLQCAARWLAENKCDIAVAGSVESSLNPLMISGFKQMGVLSDFPRPFDLRRNGFIIGEGAGIFVLERMEDARARKANIYAELAACAVGSDSYHPTSFDPSGSSIARVLARAFAEADISPAEADYGNLHGTGTGINDRIETRALKKIMGAQAGRKVFSSTKAATGHLLGAAASVEAALVCLAIRDGFVPPTLHLEQTDPECDLDYAAGTGRPQKIEAAFSLSFGFGGPVGAAVFRRV